MKLSLDSEKSVLLINSYDENSVSIQGRKISNSLVITPQNVIDNWNVKSIEALNIEDFSSLDVINPELILLGTGKTQLFAPQWLYEMAAKRQISIEIMNTGAACRTYNVLASENRKIAAYLIIENETSQLSE